MPKTPIQELDDKIETLQLQLIEENAVLSALMLKTVSEFMGPEPAREKERLLQQAKCDAIVKQIEYLTVKKSQMPTSPAHRQRPTTTKQAAIYAEVVKLRKRNPKLTNAAAFEQLAEKQEDSQEAIRKAFYAEQKRLNDEQSRAAREKRDSEGDSDQADQGEK